jgi:hypothetical protein
VCVCPRAASGTKQREVSFLRNVARDCYCQCLTHTGHGLRTRPANPPDKEFPSEKLHIVQVRVREVIDAILSGESHLGGYTTMSVRNRHPDYSVQISTHRIACKNDNRAEFVESCQPDFSSSGGWRVRRAHRARKPLPNQYRPRPVERNLPDRPGHAPRQWAAFVGTPGCPCAAAQHAPAC